MVVFSKNLYKTIASQIYRHYKNCVVVVLILYRYAEVSNTLSKKGKMFTVLKYSNPFKTFPYI